jgi:Flp pilus assembly protein TadD
MSHTLSTHLTAALAAAAFAAFGCSSNDRSTGSDERARQTTQVAPEFARTTTLSAAAPIVDKAGGKGLVGTRVMETGPASFADGEAAYQAQDYATASQIFARYADERPGNAWGHFMLGLSSWKNGDLRQAESAFGKALEIDPGHVKSLVNVSRVFIEQGRSEDALDTLMKAADLEPTSGVVHRLFGRAFAARQQTADAEAAYRRAIELDDRDAWAMNNLGLLLIEDKRADEAVPLLARAIQIRNDVSLFQNNLGMALEHTGHFAGAAQAYSGALTVDPAYEKARQNLARVEMVKAAPMEPFDLGAAARQFVEGRLDGHAGDQVPDQTVQTDETVATQAKSAGEI